MSQKITKNFSFYEFRPKGRPKTWLPSNEYQKKLIVELAQNLQIVRTAMPRRTWMQITSGLRALADYDRLVRSGYRPSKTSDHNCGNAIRLSTGSRKFKKYGPTYNFSVGAADIVPRGFSAIGLFLLAKEMTEVKECNFGQVIYEKNPRNGAEWVHFGADPSFVFSDEIVEFISRTQFMQSLNGGRSYQIA